MELFFDIQPGWLRPTRHLTTRGIARIVHTVGLAIHWAGIHDAATAHGNVDPIRPGSSAQLSNGDSDLPFTYTTDPSLHDIHCLRIRPLSILDWVSLEERKGVRSLSPRGMFAVPTPPNSGEHTLSSI